MQKNQLQRIVHQALEDLKAKDIIFINVENLTTITDVMVICSGTSPRHVKSIADNVIKASKAQGFTVVGLEGEQVGEWVLVDLGDIVVHVMLPQTREFYNLEKLWDLPKASGF